MIHFRIADWIALQFLQAFGCGRMRVMSTETTPGMPTTRRYAKQEKDRRMEDVSHLIESQTMRARVRC